MTHFGRWLDIWIREKYKTHKTAGEDLGIHFDMLGRWCRGKSLPSLPQLEILARAGFNVQGALLDTGPAGYAPEDLAALQQLSKVRAADRRLIVLAAAAQTLTDDLNALAIDLKI